MFVNDTNSLIKTLKDFNVKSKMTDRYIFDVSMLYVKA